MALWCRSCRRWLSSNRFLSSPLCIFLAFLLVMYVFNIRARFTGNGARHGSPRDPQHTKTDDVSGENVPSGVGSLAYYEDALQKLTLLEVDEDEFLSEYGKKCEVLKDNDDKRVIPICPCVPNLLYGKLPTPQEYPSWEKVIKRHPGVSPGGSHRPLHCQPRQRVVVIIPNRGRDHHLRLLLYHVIRIFQRHLLHFRIFVVEQVPGGAFNKAMMMNAAFLEARKFWGFDCVIFHDVDMLLEDDRSIYACAAEQPRHLGAYVDKYNYRLYYPELIGGAVAMKPEVFEVVNGYSNRYFGWGGEDDDMYFRLKSKGYTVERYPSGISRYQMLPHSSDRGNPENPNRIRAVNDMTERQTFDGLNSVSYIIHNVTKKELYTHLYIQPACPVQPKPYMGKSPDAGIETLVADMDMCRSKCARNRMCVALSWDMSDNNCVLHGKLVKPEAKSDSMYFKKECTGKELT